MKTILKWVKMGRCKKLSRIWGDPNPPIIHEAMFGIHYGQIRIFLNFFGEVVIVNGIRYQIFRENPVLQRESTIDF